MVLDPYEKGVPCPHCGTPIYSDMDNPANYHKPGCVLYVPVSKKKPRKER